MSISACARAVLVPAAAVLALGAAPASGTRLERTASLPAGTRLVLQTDGGSVVVRGTSRAGARVVLTSPRTDLASKVTFEVQERPGEVRIVSKRKRTSSWFGLWGSDSISRSFEVEVPARTPVEIETGGGHVEARDLQARAELHTSGGSITVTAHRGTLEAETSGGHITLEDLRGEARVATSGGRIEARRVDGPLEAVTSGGSIRAEDVRGDLHAETSGGSIVIERAGGRVEARTSGGSVTASFARGNARGGSLASSAGSVRVTLDPGVDLTIDAATSAGSVRADLPVRVEGKPSRSALRGTLGKGGNLLRLESSAGSVEISPL